MPDRSIRVRLLADIQNYRQGLAEAGRATQEFGRNITTHGDASRAQIEQVGRSSLVMSAAIGAGLGFATKATIGFDKQISELGAVSSASAKEMGELRQAAIDAGQATAFSASEAAKAQTELAKAGVSTADILGGGLAGALDLAAAGSLDLGQAAVFAATAMNTFGLQGSDMAHIADVLAAGANKSAANVDDMGLALQQSGLVADQLGISLDETVGTLAMFAQNSLRGSDAGTSFKTMLQRLTPQSDEARELMDQLGISMFTSSGSFVGLERAAEELKTGLSGLSEEQRQSALNTIFGADAIRAATLFYEGGAAGVHEWTTAVNDAGFAAEVAAKKMDNLGGDLEKLRGSIETALIEGGSKMTGALREGAQAADQIVQGFVALPGPVQTTGVALAAVATTGLGLVGVVGTLAPKLETTKRALEGMGAGGQFVSRNIGTMGKVLGVAGVAVSVYSYLLGEQAQQQAEAEAAADAYTQAIIDQGAALGGLTDAEAARRILEGSLGEGLRDAKADVDLLVDTVMDGTESFEDLWKAVLKGETSGGKITMEEFRSAVEGSSVAGTALGDELLRLADSGELTAQEMADLVKRLYEQGDAFIVGTREAKNKAEADKVAGVSAEDAAGGTAAFTAALMDNKTAGEKATDAVKDYKDEVENTFSALTGFADAQNAYEDANKGVADAQRDAAQAGEQVSRAQEGVAEAMNHVADSAQAAEDGVRGLMDAQRAQFDPLFAMIDALQAAKDAAAAAKTAKPGDKADANLDAVKAAFGVETAATSLAGAIATGNVNLTDAKKALQDWVREGLITKEQAAQVAKQFENAAKQAEKLQGAQVDNAIATSQNAAEMKAADERADMLRDANERLADAQQSAADAQLRVLDAQERVLPATINLMLAAIELSGAMEITEGFVDNAKDALDRMADQGLITQEQADAAKDSFDELAGAADNLAGKDVKLRVETALEMSDEDRMILAALARADSGLQVDANKVLARANPVQTNAVGGSLAEGWNTVGEQGWEAIYKRGSQVDVYSNSVSRQMVTSQGSAGSSTTFGAGSVVLNYPAPEPMSTALPRTRRKLAVMT